MINPARSLHRETLSDNHIRLLRWIGSPNIGGSDNVQVGSKLHFKMIEVTLGNAPAYCALSYRWQDPDPSAPDTKIICNDVDVPVGLNLWNALNRIYHLQYRPEYMWIDFVCIEQSNEEEKQLQLLLMPQIYERAFRVIVWLGPATEESSDAINTLVGMIAIMKEVDASRQPNSKVILSQDSIKVYESMLHLARTSHDGGSNYFEPVWRLLNRDWFGRVWTVQEAAAVPGRCRVLCGDKFFYYSTILDLTAGFLNNQDGDSHWIKVVDSIRATSIVRDPDKPFRPIFAHSKAVWRMHRMRDPLIPGSQSSLNAVKFLNDLRVLECSDPRDRIFSAVPFMSQQFIIAIRERGPMTAEELYILFAENELASLKNIDCLATAGLCYQRRLSLDAAPTDLGVPCLNLPSWVADWTYPKLNEPLWFLNDGAYERQGKRLYEASGKTKPDINLHVSKIQDALVVKGSIIDTVLVAGDRYRIKMMPVDLTPDKQLETVRDHLQSMITQVDECIALAMRHSTLSSFSSSPEANSITSRDHIIHQVRKALLGNVLPIISNSPDALLDRADPEQIEQVFERAQTDLAHWNKLLEEKRDGTADCIQSPAEIAAQRVADEEWKRVYRSSPILSVCLAITFKRRCFFVTRDGRFGIGPPMLQKGDRVCVFNGGATPFIIRPVRASKHKHYDDGRQPGETEIGRGYHQLVGECYVNDLMNGEVLEMEGVKAEYIRLV